MINDSYQKISDDRLMIAIDYSGMISDSFRRISFVTSDSFFCICVQSNFRKFRDSSIETSDINYSNSVNFDRTT